MRTLVFSPTYPTWAIVGGTSRPAGETVLIGESYEYLRDKHNYLLWIIIYPVSMFCNLVDTWYSAHREQRRPLSGSDTYLLGHVASAGGDSPGVVWLLRI